MRNIKRRIEEVRRKLNESTRLQRSKIRDIDVDEVIDSVQTNISVSDEEAKWGVRWMFNGLGDEMADMSKEEVKKSVETEATKISDFETASKIVNWVYHIYLNDILSY